MESVKELKSIDLSSYTIIVTGISVVFAIISSILIALGISIVNPSVAGFGIYLIPTIVVATLMYTTYNSFFGGFLYNILSKRMKTIKFAIKDNQEITQITTTETAIIFSIITTVKVLLLYLVSVILLPLFINAMVQTLMFSGQQALAYSLYQLLLIISQPTTVGMFVFGTFIITFVFVLLGTYIYNYIAKNGRNIIVNLSKENNLTVVDSIDSLKLAIAFAIIAGILNIILAIVMVISGGELSGAIGNIAGGFVGAFIEGILLGIFYNFLAPRLGKLKIELIDQ